MYRNKNSGSRIKNRGDLFVWGFVLVVMAAIAIGDVGQGPVTAGADEGIEAKDVDVSGGEVDVPIDKAIQSITFKRDVGIRDALRFLAAKYQKNIVPSPKVDGLLAFTSLFDVTFDEAMDAILGVHFKYEQKGNLIKVYTAEEYKKIKKDKDRMIHKVFTLYYISAAEARKLILPVLSSDGKIEATAPAETGVPVSEAISSDSGGGDTTAMNDTILVYDFPENIAKAEDVITSVDIRPKQVLIEATILSAKLTEDTQLGIDWQTLKGTAITALAGITQGAPDYFKSAGASKVAITGGMTIGLAYGDVAAFIRAVEEVTDVAILANPKILAVNKQLGQVYIGKKVAYVSQTTQTDTSTTEKVEFLDTGTKLSFRPYIGDDGYIRMDIHPKDSSATLRTLGSTTVPDETSAELVTNIIVKDGETIVIGGLFRDKVTANRTQIPILGDLPIVGAAFRGTADQNEREEVIVLLTPHIIEEPSQTEGQTRADDIARKRFGAKDALQWTGRARLAEDRYINAVKHYIEGNNEAAMRQINSALELRPAYLEAIRLKERIIGETDPERAAKMERIILSDIDKKEASKWRRR